MRYHDISLYNECSCCAGGGSTSNIPGVRPEPLPAVTIRVAQEQRIGPVLGRIVEAVARQEGVALARLWTVEPGDLCDACHMRDECPDRTRCLHLVASAGRSRDGRETWDGLDGVFRRFPLGVRKVGRVGATGTGILLHDMTDRSTWIVRPEWAARVAARPLRTRKRGDRR